MCLYPKLILNRKYIPNKKNGGIPPIIKDERTRYVPVGCGKCMECMKQKSRQWAVRLNEEIRTRTTEIRFITMTYSNESIVKLENTIKANCLTDIPTGYNMDNEIATLSIRYFLERWRKEFKTSVKHWFVTELGQTNTERLHIHGLIWTNESKSTVERIWKYGTVNRQNRNWEGNYVNEKTINYIVKYLNKADQKHKFYKPIILTSKGIGNNYFKRNDSLLNKYKNENTNELYKTRQGIKLPLPVYYRNNIYNDEEREKLWINLLDKNVRYVNGIKIDVSKNEDDYYDVLKHQRNINKMLGYGDDEKDWDKIRYENNLRNLKRLKINLEVENKLNNIESENADIGKKTKNKKNNGKRKLAGNNRRNLSTLRSTIESDPDLKNLVDNWNDLKCIGENF